MQSAAVRCTILKKDKDEGKMKFTYSRPKWLFGPNLRLRPMQFPMKIARVQRDEIIGVHWTLTDWSCEIEFFTLNQFIFTSYNML